MCTSPEQDASSDRCSHVTNLDPLRAYMILKTAVVSVATLPHQHVVQSKWEVGSRMGAHARGYIDFLHPQYEDVMASRNRFGTLQTMSVRPHGSATRDGTGGEHA